MKEGRPGDGGEAGWWRGVRAGRGRLRGGCEVGGDSG